MWNLYTKKVLGSVPSRMLWMVLLLIILTALLKSLITMPVRYESVHVIDKSTNVEERWAHILDSNDDTSTANAVVLLTQMR